jgi:phosphatidylserine/phosphatidylglycerophosphate/cardiolipin synthase-like enzyme
MPQKIKMSKAQGGIVALLVTVLLMICGAFASLAGPDVVDALASATPSVEVAVTLPPVVITETPFTPDVVITDTPIVLAPTAVPPSADWWEVYFTDPVNMNKPNVINGSVEEKLIRYIDAAQSSIHIASFEFNLTAVARALIAAKERGVDVRWVTDNQHGLLADRDPGRGQFAMIRAAGIEVRDDLGRSAFMHNKFWIFDRQIVWTGSTNSTRNGVYAQNNNVIVIRSPELAEIYEREFEEMWNGQFGVTSASTLAEQSLIINGTPIQVIFTSEDRALEPFVIPLVQRAESSVYFMAFSFTDFPLADAMIQRYLRGVDVAGVFETFGSETEAAELRTLFCAEVPVRQDGNKGFLHHKVVIVDERYVVTGSLNFSTRAETTNDENVIIIDNPDIARLFVEEFERVWALGKDANPEKMACP